MSGGERGAALLEALVAVVVLSASGMAAIELLGESTRQLGVAMGREREIVDAARVLSAATLLDRADLDLRLGDRWVAGLVVNVQRPEPDLYRIAVGFPRGDSVVAPSELLVTVVYRPAEERRP